MKPKVNKEMKKLNRAELLDIIYEMKKNEEKLQGMLNDAQIALEKKTLIVDNAGSIAEAALALNDIFSAAQNAADTYVESMRARYSGMEQKNTTAESERKKLLEAAKVQADQIVKDAEKKSAEMIANAEKNIKEREEKFKSEVSKVLSANSELRALLKHNG